MSNEITFFSSEPFLNSLMEDHNRNHEEVMSILEKAREQADRMKARQEQLTNSYNTRIQEINASAKEISSVLIFCGIALVILGFVVSSSLLITLGSISFLSGYYSYPITSHSK